MQPPYTEPEPHRPRHRARLTAAVTAAVLVGGGTGALVNSQWGDHDHGESVVAPATTNEPTGNESSTTVSAQKVAAEVLPSTVTITVSLPDGSGDGGSGVVLTSDGKIMTNNHVVAAAKNGAGQIEVTFHDGTSRPARIVGTDAVSDLAVIQAERTHDAKPAQLGRSKDLAAGQSVVAIGSPLQQQLAGTVTSGVVSALNRPVNTSDSGQGTDAAQGTVIDAIQTDAAINPGNSGGPLLDMDGRVIGINQSIPGNSAGGNIGIGFAIPIDEARPIIEKLAAGAPAEHAQLGVTATDATTRLGAQLRQVTGAAKDAGLEAGDVITKFGDRQISSADDLVAAVRSHRPDDSISVTYERGGSEHRTKATLGSDRDE
ncbi:MAG TPA: trypsin-like peptidase domain-containing protein [Mycobacteriales bacterium]|nr:trypsin-like peptidase domain-containing protein [Mycobacteriales bacterium]